MSFLDLTFFPFTSLSDQLIHIADVALFGQHKTFSLPWVALASCPPQHHWYMCICCPTAQPSRRLPLGRLKLCSSITSPLNLVCRGALPSHLSSCFLTDFPTRPFLFCPAYCVTLLLPQRKMLSESHPGAPQCKVAELPGQDKGDGEQSV